MTPTQSPKERGEKMREFIVYGGESGLQVTEALGAFTNREVRFHVIEYSALTALEHKLEVAIKERDEAMSHAAIHNEQMQKSEMENERLKSEIAVLKAEKSSLMRSLSQHLGDA